MKVLVTSTPGKGHLGILLPLMAALRAAGHQLLTVTAAESCESVRGAGFDVREGGLSSDDRRASFETRMPEAMALPPRRRRGLFFAGFFADGAAPVMRQALLPVFDEFRPDVVVSERGELAATPIAAARGIPHAVVAFSGALPDWSDELVIDSIAPVWAAEGLARPTMAQLNGDVYLHPFPPAFGQSPASGTVRPMRATPAPDPAATAPDWLDALGRTRPLIYLTGGTEPAAARAPWQAAMEALGGLDVDVVATIGTRVDPSLLGEIPPNVRVERFVPQHFVFERASLSMSHAGAGSLLGAAGSGLPHVLFPSFADQWENADAASSAEVAVTLEVDQRSSEAIHAAVSGVLREESFKDTASRVAEEIAAMPSPHDHVATIEALSIAGPSG